MNRRFPASAYNPLSILGAFAALASFCVIIFLVLIDLFSEQTSPYMGIIAFVIMPSILVIGLISIPIGMYIERKRMLRTKTERKHAFYVDFDKPSHRMASIIFVAGTIIFLLSTAVGSYQAYEYTESVEFCGEVCHAIMEPEYVAHQNSAHARVTCAECHVGAGAGWYVQSKLSGAYQVYAATFNLYPRPIPTPIENLRPARETCEQCHWPSKFHGSSEKVFNHYMVDEENTHWPIRMLIKTGGGDRETGEATGIHWHLNQNNKIEYIATDEKRLQIPWVRVTDKDGKETIYISEMDPIEPEEVDNFTKIEMSCIDCHNRPAHVYRSPSKAFNDEMAAGKLPALPSMKRIAIESMIGDEYETKEAAFEGISEAINTAYADEYPEITETKSVEIDKLISSVNRIYAQNIFPYMKVRWDEYPEHVGHFLSPGCYRCHDGMHSSEEGEVISNDCNSCHTILSQGTEDEEQAISPNGIEFKHPVDIDEAWKEMACSECHTGTSQL